MTKAISVGLVAILVIAACGKKQSEGAPERGAQTMSDMQGMRMRSDSLMPLMRAHLDSMAALDPQFAAGMMARHDAMASQMLDAMGADMTAMGMRPDPAWTALTDSIKRDLADLPTRSGRALDQRVRAHIQRMRRLMTVHEAMMRGMPPRSGGPVPPPRVQQVVYAPLRGRLRLPPSVNGASPAVRELYEFAARRPDVLRYLPCFCGCANAGHRSNYDCFIDEVRPDGDVVIDEMGFT